MEKYIISIIISISVFSRITFDSEEYVKYGNTIPISIFFAAFYCLLIKGVQIKKLKHLTRYSFLLITFFLSDIINNNVIDINAYESLIKKYIFFISITVCSLHIKSVRPIIYGFVAFLFINVFLYYNIIPINTDLYIQNRYVGLSKNPNEHSIKIIFGIFSLLYITLHKIKIITIIQLTFVIVSAFICFETGSKKAIIGVTSIFLFIIYWFYQTKNKYRFFSLISVFFCVYIIIDSYEFELELILLRFESFFEQIDTDSINLEGSTVHRMYLMNEAFNGFLSAPIIGHGLHSFGQIYNVYSHCNYTELLYSVGIIGFCIYYSIYVYLLRAVLTLRNINNDTNHDLIICSMGMLIVSEIAMVTFYSNTNLIWICFCFVHLQIAPNMTKNLMYHIKTNEKKKGSSIN